MIIYKMILISPVFSISGKGLCFSIIFTKTIGSAGVAGGGPSDTLGAVGLRPPDLEAPGEDTLPDEGFEGDEQPDMGGTESPISGAEGILPPGEVPQ